MDPAISAIAGATIESLKWSVDTSNATTPEPIVGKPPKKAWLEKHKFDDVDFSLPTPPGLDDTLRRRLGQPITTYACYNYKRQKYVGSVQIWWTPSFQQGTWACNNWLQPCRDSSCNAYEVTKSHWNCYREHNLKMVGQVSIWWGHGIVDGVWACNNWVSGCHPGGCLVTGAAHWEDDPNTWSCNVYKQSDGCSGGVQHERDALAFACDQHDYCYYGPIKKDFAETYRHCSNLFYDEVRTRHWGDLDYYRIVGETWKNAMTWDPLWNGGRIQGPGFGDGFQNRQMDSDWACFLGKSTPRGYTLPCQDGGGCRAGTTCYDCCDGDTGWACNEAWWKP